MSIDYVKARFREYYPDAERIEVIFDETIERWTSEIIRPFANSPDLANYPDQVWTFEVSSEDERFVFTRDFDTPDVDPFTDIITIPFPREPFVPLWSTEMFTPEEQDRMTLAIKEDISGSLKEYAHEYLNSEDDLVELIALADEDPGTTHDMLKAILDLNAGMDDYKSGDHEDHVKQADFMERHKLVDSVGDVTELGRKFIERMG